MCWNKEPIFVFDRFFREDAPIILEKMKQKNESGPYKFSFKNIFNFKKMGVDSENEFMNEKESFDEFFIDTALKIEIDKRAAFSNFKYETMESLLTNNQSKEVQEDEYFLKFFFEVSNSQMVENMEKFLNNYLTLSKKQKETFSKSNIRRKSLQSVLSILKHSDTSKNSTMFSKLMNNDKFSDDLMKKGLNNTQNIRLQLLKKAFSIKKKDIFELKKERSRSEDVYVKNSLLL
jgi:hypothetical protein